MDPMRPTGEPLNDVQRAAQPPAPVQDVPATAASAQVASPHGFSLVDAIATLGDGRSLVTDLVFGSDNQVSQVRVLDAQTHRVVAECPPDTIAQAQRELLAYQDVARAQPPREIAPAGGL